MRTAKHILLVAMALVVSGCGGSEEAGGEEMTPGDGGAIPGNGDMATGGGNGDGASCENCSNGCCDGDTCIPFSIQTDSQCGADGTTCGGCARGQTCSSGSCETDFSVCSSYSCDGCCDVDGECIATYEMSSEQCGQGGLTCQQCVNYGTTCESESGSCSSLLDPSAAFALRIGAVSVGTTLPGGENWDPFEGLPELYVGLSLNGATEEEIAGCPDDSLSCSLDKVSATTVTGQDLTAGNVRLTVYDRDLDSPETGGSTTVSISEWEDTYELAPFGAVTNLTISLESP